MTKYISKAACLTFINVHHQILGMKCTDTTVFCLVSSLEGLHLHIWNGGAGSRGLGTDTAGSGMLRMKIARDETCCLRLNLRLNFYFYSCKSVVHTVAAKLNTEKIHANIQKVTRHLSARHSVCIFDRCALDSKRELF